MPDLEWSDEAQADLLAIIDLISDRSPDATQRLKDDIEGKVAAIPDYPRMHRSGRVRGTREMLVHSNYVVVYAETVFMVTILRVLHAAQQWPAGR